MKKYLSLILIALLIVACLPVASFAAADAATISGANVTAVPGGKASVTFSITEANYATFSMSVVYEKEDLTLTGLTAGEASPANFGTNAERFNAAQDFDGKKIDENTYAKFSGVIVTVNFDVPADAVVGDVYPVTLDVRNVTNSADEVLTIDVVDGSVTIVAPNEPSEPTTTPTEPSTAPTTEPTTAPTTEPTTAPTTEPTTAPTTEPTTAPTTEPTTAPTTVPDDPGDDPSMDDEPNTGDFTFILAAGVIMVVMVPCLLVAKFRAVK